MIISTIIKVTTKVAICSYVNKIVLTATIVKYKVEVAHSASNIIAVTKTIGLAVKPIQIKVTTQLVELLT